MPDTQEQIADMAEVFGPSTTEGTTGQSAEEAVEEQVENAQGDRQQELSGEEEEVVEEEETVETEAQEQEEEAPEAEEQEQETEASEEEEEELTEIEKMRRRLEQTAAQQRQEPDSELSVEEGEEEPQGEEEETQQPNIVEFVDGETLEQATSDPEKFNEVMTEAMNTFMEQALRSVPEVARRQIQAAEQQREMRQKFYNENPELKEYQNFVGTVANEIQSENPDMERDELLTRTAQVAKDRLELHQEAEEKEQERQEKEEEASQQSNSENNDPQFAPKPRGGRRTQSSDSQSQREGDAGQIDRMLDATEF